MNNQNKFCPFMSNQENLIPCNPNCKLYRNKPGYECSFQELQSISWNTGKREQTQNNYPQY